MWRNELVTLGDVFDFFEWRRVNRGVPYYFQGIIPNPNPNARPSIRFYVDLGRLYAVGCKGGQLHRLTIGCQRASVISCCAFGDNKKTTIDVTHVSYDRFHIRVETPAITVSVHARKGVMSSLFENGYVKESAI